MSERCHGANSTYRTEVDGADTRPATRRVHAFFSYAFRTFERRFEASSPDSSRVSAEVFH